jgi:probable F420-dependent oxidoreductase
VKIGLFNINNNVCSYPENMTRVAKAAEEAGFESLWTGEHVVLPDPQVPPSPVPPEGRMLDGGIALTWAAAHTSTIRLGTGIIILPQRNPLVLAKELASLDVLSGGRLIFGVGVGYLKPEFDALGIPLDDRATRSVEYIEAMYAIWSMAKPEYQGTYVSYSGVQANPRPVQQPGPPLVMGGRSAPAYRRAVTMSNGWYGFALDPEATAQCLDGLAREAAAHERPAELGRLEISVTPRARPTPETVEQYAELGVDRLIWLPNGDTVDDWLAFVDKVGSELIA